MNKEKVTDTQNNRNIKADHSWCTGIVLLAIILVLLFGAKTIYSLLQSPYFYNEDGTTSFISLEQRLGTPVIFSEENALTKDNEYISILPYLKTTEDLEPPIIPTDNSIEHLLYNYDNSDTDIYTDESIENEINNLEQYQIDFDMQAWNEEYIGISKEEYLNTYQQDLLISNSVLEADSYITKRGILEMYSLYKSPSMKMLYNIILDELSLGNDIDTQDVSTWAGGYKELNSLLKWKDIISDAVHAVIIDYPMFSIYSAGDTTTTHYSPRQNQISVSSAFNNSDDDFFQLAWEVEQNAQKIDQYAWEASEGDPIQYIKTVFTILSLQNTYADGIDDSIYNNTIYGAMVEGETKCFGGAAAIKYLLDKHEIPCFIDSAVDTSEDNSGHAWVTIFLRGNWYACDLTKGMAFTKSAVDKDWDDEYIKRHLEGLAIIPMNVYQNNKPELSRKLWTKDLQDTFEKEAQVTPWSPTLFSKSGPGNRMMLIDDKQFFENSMSKIRNTIIKLQKLR